MLQMSLLPCLLVVGAGGRETAADLWRGCWGNASFPKPYIFCIQVRLKGLAGWGVLPGVLQGSCRLLQLYV